VYVLSTFENKNALHKMNP